MKKTLLAITALFAMSLTASAQETRPIGRFSKLNVRGAFEIRLVAGKSGLVLHSDKKELLGHIKTEIKDNTLSIYVEAADRENYDNVTIDVPINGLEEIAFSGSGSVTSDIPVSSANLKISLSGSGDIVLDVDAKNVEAGLDGSGDLTLKGKASAFKGSLVGSGDLDADGLHAENVEISVVGSGDANVYASENIKASVAGSGDIKYKGNPKNEATEATGSGSIEKG